MIQKSKYLVLLLILFCSGCYNKTTSFTPYVYHQCMEDFIDVRIVSIEQGGNFTLQNIIAPFTSLFRIDVGYKTTRMRAQMTIRNGYENIKWTVFGEGTDRDFNWGAQTEVPRFDVPVGYRRITPYLDSISGLTRKTIRDGFKKLKEVREEQEPWDIIIDEISDEGKIYIPFGLSNGLKDGDILPIYSKDDLNNIKLEQIDEKYCQNIENNEYPILAIAEIVNIEGRKSNLEIVLPPEDGKSIQVGDIVKGMSKGNIDAEGNKRRQLRRFRGGRSRPLPLRESRSNKEDILKNKKSLRLGIIYGDIEIEVGGFVYRDSIASLLRESVLEEAEEFGFQVFIGSYSMRSSRYRNYNQNQNINYNP